MTHGDKIMTKETGDIITNIFGVVFTTAVCMYIFYIIVDSLTNIRCPYCKSRNNKQIKSTKWKDNFNQECLCGKCGKTFKVITYGPT